MPRIRTIKPEMPQSESMGKISRDARLCFIMLWTLADDEGRGRGASKMLASLLFPYDDDAPSLIDGWLNELELAECIVRYSIDGSSLFQILNWRSHQKIDKPTPSKFPAPNGLITKRDSERDIEGSLFSSISKSGALFGRKIIDLQRQVRVGSSYLDIVAVTESGSFVLEIKRDRLAAADIDQVLRYSKSTGAAPVLVGSGISPAFPVDLCRNEGIAVLVIKNDGAVSLAIPSSHVDSCEISLDSAPERYPLDQGSRNGEEGIKEVDQAAASAASGIDKSGEKPKRDKTILSLEDLLAMGIDEQVAKDFMAHRKRKKADLTMTALNGIKREADKAGYTLSMAMATCVTKGWTGFEADWVSKKTGFGQQSLTEHNAAAVEEALRLSGQLP